MDLNVMEYMVTSHIDFQDKSYLRQFGMRNVKKGATDTKYYNRKNAGTCILGL